MTIPSDTSKSGPYNGNGVTTVFSRNFRVLSDDHIKVYQTVSGVTTEVTTGITKDGIGSDSGNVTFATAPATGAQITLVREVPLTQETDYSSQGKVSPEQVEDDFDLQEMQIQDMKGEVLRSVKLPITSTLSDVEMADPTAGGVLIGRPDGQGWENGPAADEIANAQGYAAQAAASATEAEAAADVLTGAVTFSTSQKYTAAQINAGAVTLPAVPVNKDCVWVVAGTAGPQGPDEFTLDGDQLTLTGGLPDGVDDVQIWVMSRVTDFSAPVAVTGEGLSFENLASAKAAIAIGLSLEVGMRLNVGEVQFLYDGVSSGLAGMPGYKTVGQISFQHFGDNTTPGTTDMTAAVQALLEYLNAGQTTEWQAANSTQAQRVSGLGEVIAMGGAAYAGSFDADQDGTAELGCGPLYGVSFFDVTFKAIDTGTSYSADLATDADVGRPMLFVGEYLNSTFTSNNEFNVSRIRFEETCEFDCNFLSDGAYFENTARCRVAGPVYNIRKGGYGYATSYQNSALNSRGFSTKNMEIEFRDHRADGNHRLDGNSDFPPGEDITTMDNTGLWVRSNDFKVSNWDATNCTTAARIDGKAGQIHNLHPWSRQVIFGENADKITATNIYWDYTDVIVYRPSSGAQNIQFVGCDWREGACNLRIVAQRANDDADGLQLSACQFTGGGDLLFETTGAGSWVASELRKISIIGTPDGGINGVVLKQGTALEVYQSGAFKTPFLLADNDGSFDFGRSARSDGGTVGRVHWTGDDLTIAGNTGAGFDTFNSLTFDAPARRWMIGSGTYGRSVGQDFAAFADFVNWWSDAVSVGFTPTGGTTVRIGVLSWVFIPVGHVLYGTDPISDLPGWMADGGVRPEHHGAVGDGTTDDTTAIQEWASFVDGGFGALSDDRHYVVSDEIVFTEGGTTIRGHGTIEQTTWGLSGIQAFGDDFTIDAANIITRQTKTILSTAISARFLGDVARARSSALYLAGHRARVGSDVRMAGFVHGATLAGHRVWRENITVSAATTTTFPLDAGDARADQEYVGAVIRLLNTIDSPVRTITAYDQGTNTVTVDEPFSSAPNAAGVYYVIWMGRQEDVEIGDVSINLTDFGIVPTWVDNLTVGKISAYNGEQSQGADAPPHTIYVTGDSKRLRSRNIVVDDCLTEDSFGTAYKFRGVDGLALGVMQAHRARGIGAIEHCVGVVAAGWTGTNLGALYEGQPTGVFVVGGANVHVGDISAVFDPDYVGGVAAVDYRPVGLFVQNDLDGTGDYTTATDVSYGTVTAEWAGSAQAMFGVLCSQQTGSTASPATQRVRGDRIVVKAAGAATAFRVSNGDGCLCNDVISLASGTNIAVQFDAGASGCTAFIDADVNAGSATNNGTGCVVLDFTLDPATLPTYSPTGQETGTSFGMVLSNQGGSSHGLRGDSFAGLSNATRWRQSGGSSASAYMVWSYGDSATEWIAINGNGSAIRFGNATSMKVQNAAGSTVAEVLSSGGVRVGGTSGPVWLSGAGTPEGVVTSPVGSIFSRTDGGAGTSMYIKESGVGNTGWVAK